MKRTKSLYLTLVRMAMTQLARPNSKSFLKSPGQQLLEYMVLVSGKWIFARLDFREQWPRNATYAVGKKLV